jgi:GntR family transcriptional regulator
VSHKGVVNPIKSTEPLTEQVYSYLRDLLQDAHFSPGQKLPSETDLAQQLNVSRVSLRGALQRLELEGYIERKRGVGTFVIDRHPLHVEAGIEKLISMSDVVRSRGKAPGTGRAEVAVELASAEVASKLNLDEGDPVTVVNRVRTMDGEPFCWDSSRIPYKFMRAPESPESIGTSLFQYVEEELGLYVGHAVARLLPDRADDYLAQKLGVPVDTLLIKLDQVHYLQDDAPIWYSTLWYPDTKFSWYIVRMR